MANVYGAQSMPTLQVTVPEGFSGGSSLQVKDPTSGQILQVTIPDGMRPGDVFQVQVPPTTVHAAPVQQQMGYAQQQAPQPTYVVTKPAQPQTVIITQRGDGGYYDDRRRREEDEGLMACLLGMCACCTMCLAFDALT